MGIIVRFPPSPTGRMHVGNARTALFNWLFARHTGGKFVVRIEDTDKERSTKENIAYIYEALEWLGLDYDNKPFLQTSRVQYHTQAAQLLVTKGAAYVDDEGVTRFRVPAGSTSWKDLVQGEITIENKQIEDFALLRSDGSPTYHLGVVCDDVFQEVTHVIRGDDHINNTPKHILLYLALDAKLPQFGHLPMILGPDGEKLSKRHGATSIQDLRDAGYLPQAVFNYILRLGWGHGDQEIFSVEEATRFFDVHDVSPGAAQFDTAKLNWLNEHYLRSLPMEDVMPHLKAFLPHEGKLDKEEKARLTALWPDLTARATTLPQVVEAAAPLFTDPSESFTEEHTHALLEAHHMLHHLYDDLSRVSEWEEQPLHDVLHHAAEHAGGFKKVGKPLRIALTGRTGGPDLARFMAAIGQQETFNRLKKALHHVHDHGGHHH